MAHDWIVAGVDHHVVPKVSNVLNLITHFRVAVKSGSQEFSRELAPLDLIEERKIVDFL